MKTILCGLPLFLLCSCAGRQAITAPLPSAPPLAAPVARDVSRMRDAIADADKQANAIHTAARDSRSSVAEAETQSARLAEKGTATPAELNSLWKAIQTAEARNLFLEEEAGRLTSMLASLRSSAAELEAKAAARDAEATALRGQNIHLTDRVITSDRMTATSQDEASKQRARADRLAGETRLHRIALAVAAALLIGFLALKFLLPLR